MKTDEPTTYREIEHNLAQWDRLLKTIQTKDEAYQEAMTGWLASIDHSQKALVKHAIDLETAKKQQTDTIHQDLIGIIRALEFIGTKIGDNTEAVSELGEYAQTRNENLNATCGHIGDIRNIMRGDHSQKAAAKYVMSKIPSIEECQELPKNGKDTAQLKRMSNEMEVLSDLGNCFSTLQSVLDRILKNPKTLERL